jgi:hypothetical protein
LSKKAVKQELTAFFILWFRKKVYLSGLLRDWDESFVGIDTSLSFLALRCNFFRRTPNTGRRTVFGLKELKQWMTFM